MGSSPIYPTDPAPVAARAVALVLLLAALDSLATGLWAVVRPDALFELLEVSPGADARLLWRVLGVSLAIQGVFLVMAALRPADRGLVLVPAAGRAVLSGVWLWLLGTDRVSMPTLPLKLLLLHDGVVLIVLVAVLLLSRARATEKAA